MQGLLGAREQGGWRKLPTNMVVIGTRLVSGMVKCPPGARERQLPSGMGPVDHAAQRHPSRLWPVGDVLDAVLVPRKCEQDDAVTDDRQQQGLTGGGVDQCQRERST